ncbi:MAG: hypothetical protein IJY90_03430 [Clostridia bacterium]|nr:hypothetical protein [Clostridia bacterium]
MAKSQITNRKYKMTIAAMCMAFVAVFAAVVGIWAATSQSITAGFNVQYRVGDNVAAAVRTEYYIPGRDGDGDGEEDGAVTVTTNDSRETVENTNGYVIFNAGEDYSIKSVYLGEFDAEGNPIGLALTPENPTVEFYFTFENLLSKGYVQITESSKITEQDNINLNYYYYNSSDFALANSASTVAHEAFVSPSYQNIPCKTAENKLNGTGSVKIIKVVVSVANINYSATCSGIFNFTMRYSEESETVVAYIEENGVKTYYGSLAEAAATVPDMDAAAVAMAKAASNDGAVKTLASTAITQPAGATTIYLCGNAAGDGVRIPSNKNIIFDFNGFTYAIDGKNAGSSLEGESGFQIIKNSYVTFTNGSLMNGTNGAKVMISNYGHTIINDFNVDGVTGDGKDAVNALDCGYGELLFTGDSNITIGTEQYSYVDEDENGELQTITGYPQALCMKYGILGSYITGFTVTFDENYTGTVTGPITYTYNSERYQEDSYMEKMHLNIYAGTFVNTELNYTCSRPSIKLYGGTFPTTVDMSAFVAPFYEYSAATGKVERLETKVARDINKTREYAYFESIDEALDGISAEDFVQIVLGDDYNDQASDGIVVGGAANVEIDLNGFTYATTTITALYESTLKIKNGTIVSNVEGYDVICADRASKVTVEDVTINCDTISGPALGVLSAWDEAVIYVTGETNIYAGSSIVAHTDHVFAGLGKIIFDKNFVGNVVGVIDTLSDSYIRIAGGTFSQDVSDFVYKGYQCISAGDGKYAVSIINSSYSVAVESADGTISYYSTAFKTVLRENTQNGDTVYLINNYQAVNFYTSKNVIIDFQDNYYRASSSYIAGKNVVVTLQNGEMAPYRADADYVFKVRDGASVKLSNMRFCGTNNNDGTDYFASTLLSIENATVEFADGVRFADYDNSTHVIESSTGSIIVTSGFYHMDELADAANIVVSGGVFNGDPSSICEDFYKATVNGDYYTVEAVSSLNYQLEVNGVIRSYYSDFDELLSNVQEGQTNNISVRADIETQDTELTYSTMTTVVINLNGYTWSIADTGVFDNETAWIDSDYISLKLGKNLNVAINDGAIKCVPMDDYYRDATTAIYTEASALILNGIHIYHERLIGETGSLGTTIKCVDGNTFIYGASMIGDDVDDEVMVVTNDAHLVIDLDTNGYIPVVRNPEGGGYIARDKLTVLNVPLAKQNLSFYTALGYECVDNGDGTYMVAKSTYGLAYDTAEGYKYVNHISDAVSKISSSGTIYVLKNEQAAKGGTISNKNITIDAMGKACHLMTPITLSSGASLTLKNGTFRTHKMTAQYVVVQSGCSLALENATIEGYRNVGNGTIYNMTAVFVLSGGTVTMDEHSIIDYINPDDGHVVVALQITAGTYSLAELEAISTSISITGGTFDADVSEYVAEGYTCSGSGSTWTVSAVV